MIEARHLTKRYGELTAIEDVSFDLRKGEILGFLGPNGAGKSTTMKILTCCLPATSGTATVAGFDLFRDPMKIKARIGNLPENPPLYLDMSVRAYLGFVGRLKGMSGAKLRGRIDWVVERCGLAEVKDRLIANLSKGFKQRVGIAQALVHEPEIIVLDEPTIGLDPRQIIEIRSLIRSLAGEHSIILSTHILPEVKTICDRVLIINRGRIVIEDTVDNLENSGKKLEEVFVELINKEERAESLSSEAH